MSNKNSFSDLKTLLKSLACFSPGLPIIVMCDDHVKNELKDSYQRVEVIDGLEPYSDKNRRQMEYEGIFKEFTLKKLDVITYALQKYKNTLFLDADIILLQSLKDIIPAENLLKDCGLSPHLIKEENEKQYGIYNSGFMYISNIQVVEWWREAAKTSTFFEQKALDDLPFNFATFFFEPQNNFGWWRLCECDEPMSVANKFCIENNIILYDNKPLNSVHTHIGDTFIYTEIFNTFLVTMIRQTNNRQLFDIFQMV